jgi:hypothetical protein
MRFFYLLGKVNNYHNREAIDLLSDTFFWFDVENKDSMFSFFKRVSNSFYACRLFRVRAVQGIVLSDQVKNLDWRIREAEFLCKLPEETVAETLGKLLTLLSTRD